MANAFTDTNFTGDIDITGATTTATANVGTTSATGTLLTVQGDDSSAKTLGFINEASNIHFGIGVSGSVTGSSDAGDDLLIRAYQDDGTLIDTPVTITRASGGTITLARNLSNSGYSLTTNSLTCTGFTVGSNTASSRNVTFNSAAATTQTIFFQKAGTNKGRITFDASDGLTFYTGSNTLALTIDSSQLATFVGNIAAGTSGSARGTLTCYHGSGGNTPGYVRMHSPNGTAWTLFVEDDGTVKVMSGTPTANTDGTVVGGQS